MASPLEQGCAALCELRHNLLMRNTRARIVNRFLHLGTKPLIVCGGFVGALHAF
jgi:hypothetical protein